MPEEPLSLLAGFQFSRIEHQSPSNETTFFHGIARLLQIKDVTGIAPKEQRLELQKIDKDIKDLEKRDQNDPFLPKLKEKIDAVCQVIQDRYTYNPNLRLDKTDRKQLDNQIRNIITDLKELTSKAKKRRLKNNGKENLSEQLIEPTKAPQVETATVFKNGQKALLCDSGSGSDQKPATPQRSRKRPRTP